MKLWTLTGLITTALLLTACVSLSPPKPLYIKFSHVSWQQHQRRIHKIQHFIASGAFSIVKADQKPILAHYSWHQKNAHYYQIRVDSPLNLFNLMILGRPHSVLLQGGSKPPIAAATPEQLVQYEMGWSLPIRNLYYWIRGAIAPGTHQPVFNFYGHLVSLIQNGWSIQFSDYTTVEQADLPQKLILTRPGLQMTLVIRHWNLT